MAIDLVSEQVVSLSQAARMLPGRPHLSTIWRWHQRGVRGCRLETIIVGGRRFTSREACQRFAEAVTQAADGPAIASPTPKQRERQIAAAERELAAEGI